ncbi:hypothetical protein D3C80_1378390 [compost metagenome]
MIDQRFRHKPGGIRIGMLCFRLGCSRLLSGGNHIQISLLLTVFREYSFKYPTDDYCRQHQQKTNDHNACRADRAQIEGVLDPHRVDPECAANETDR